LDRWRTGTPTPALTGHCFAGVTEPAKNDGSGWRKKASLIALGMYRFCIAFPCHFVPFRAVWCLSHPFFLDAFSLYSSGNTGFSDTSNPISTPATSTS
jgi:hypothetical protein